MISSVTSSIPELLNMKKYPKEVFYTGNLELLKRKRISIVGTRRPSTYTKEFTYKLASNVIYMNKLKYTKINLNIVFYSFKIL